MTQPKVQLPRDGRLRRHRGFALSRGPEGRPGSTPKRLRPRRAQSRGAGQDRGALPSGVPPLLAAPPPPASSGTHFLVSGRPIFRQLLESVSAPGQRFRRPGCQGCPAVSRGSSPGRLRACAAGRRPAPRVAA